MREAQHAALKAKHTLKKAKQRAIKEQQHMVDVRRAGAKAKPGEKRDRWLLIRKVEQADATKALKQAESELKSDFEASSQTKLAASQKTQQATQVASLQVEVHVLAG